MADHLLPERESDGRPTQELLQPTEVDDGLLRPFLEPLRRYSAEVERRAGERIAEYIRECKRDITSLQNQRDTALSDLRQERASAETNAQNLEEQIRVLRESVSELELSLEEKIASMNNLTNQLDERSIELSDAEARYSMMERTLLHSLARAENENTEMREQLIGMRDQIDRANSLVTEERSRNDNYRAELATVLNQVQEVQRQKIDNEGRLGSQITELTTINNRLERDLVQARVEAELLLTMRQEREELDAKCQALTEEVCNLKDGRRSQQDTINAIEGQRDAMSIEVRRLEGDLHDEQAQSTELQLTISNQLRELDELSIERDGLQSAMNELTNDNAELRATCSRLTAEITDLKLITSEHARVKAKNPRFPATVKYKNSPPKM
jgi:chromosome segregation protein